MAHPLRCYKKGDYFPTLVPGMMRLYSMRYCPYSQRVWLVLEHKKFQYEIIFVWLRDKSPDWMKQLHPTGAVPVLQMDNKVLYESIVCAQYLDDLSPNFKLTPCDSYQKARQSILMSGWNKVTSAYNEVVKNLCDKEKWDEMQQQLEIYEVQFGDGYFFGGLEPSLLDFVIWPWFERFPAFALLNCQLHIDKWRFPKLTAWTNRMLELSAVQACYICPEVHAAVIRTFSSDRPNYGYGMD